MELLSIMAAQNKYMFFKVKSSFVAILEGDQVSERTGNHRNHYPGNAIFESVFGYP